MVPWSSFFAGKLLMMNRIVPLVVLTFFPLTQLGERGEPAARAQAAVALAYNIVTRTRPPSTPPVRPQPDAASPVGLNSYREAYTAYTENQRPMVVLVTATWCPHCPAIKSQLLAMQREGRLADASLVVLDYDQQTNLAKEIMGNHRTLPFVALFTHETDQARSYRQMSLSQLTRRLTPRINAPEYISM